MRATAIIAMLAGMCCLPESVRAALQIDPQRPPVTVSVESLEKAPPMSLEVEPTVTIGVESGAAAYELFRVTTALRLPDGHLAVLNSGTQEVRLFDSTGRFVIAQGRRGNGPAEYQFPTAMWVGRGDTLAVWDARHRRVTQLSPRLSFVRDVTLRGDGGYQEAVGPFDDGTLTVGEVEQPGGLDGAKFQFTMVYRRYAPDGTPLNVIGRFPGRTMTLHQLPNGAVEGSAPLVFDAGSKVVSSGAVLWVGTTKAPELRQFGAGGELRMIVRWIEGDRRVTPAMQRAYERRPVVPREPVTFAVRLPSHGCLVADGIGGVWMQEYRTEPPGNSSRWFHWASDGALTGQLTLQEGQQLLSATEDEIVVLIRDELGVERVQAFAFLR